MAKKKKKSSKLPKTKKDEQKKNRSKSISKRGAKKKGRGKEKNKRAGRRQLKTPSRSKRGKFQKRKIPLKKKSTGPARDFRGQYIEGHYKERLQRLKKELIDSGVLIDGKKVTKNTPWYTITKAIYENKLFTLAEQHTVSYFDVLGKIVTEVNNLKEGQEIFVKVKPFFKDFRIFNIAHEPVSKEKKYSFYSQGVKLNPQLVETIESQSALIQRVIDEYPTKIISPLFRIKEKRYENPVTGATYALEYDYNDIIPSGMDRGEFISFLQAIMGDEYRKIALLRIKANLGKFSDEE